MADRLRFHRLAPDDLRDAINWYDEISVELANRFRGSVESCLDKVDAHPEAFAVAFDDVRFARIERFPYLILFREDRDTVHVLGVFHSASDMEKWRHRL